MVSSTELVRAIAAETGESQKAVKEIIRSFWSNVQKNVEAGEEVRFIGIGKFFKKHTDARSGRNPQTGDEITIPASDKLAFKSALKLG